MLRARRQLISLTLNVCVFFSLFPKSKTLNPITGQFYEVVQLPLLSTWSWLVHNDISQDKITRCVRERQRGIEYFLKFTVKPPVTPSNRILSGCQDLRYVQLCKCHHQKCNFQNTQDNRIFAFVHFAKIKSLSKFLVIASNERKNLTY